MGCSSQAGDRREAPSFPPGGAAWAAVVRCLTASRACGSASRARRHAARGAALPMLKPAR